MFCWVKLRDICHDHALNQFHLAKIFFLIFNSHFGAPLQTNLIKGTKLRLQFYQCAKEKVDFSYDFSSIINMTSSALI